MPAAAAVAFWDPLGERFGIPTWPWRMAPPHLLTRTQLTAQGLRPAQPVQGQVLWRSRRARATGWVRVAYLYDVRLARPKRTPSPAQLQALERALTARRRCPDCGVVRSYVIPTSRGACNDCIATAA